MGFHLVDRVYANVTGTSPTAQAVLAYLAHRADDKGVRKCFPNRETIAAATHFAVRSVATALNDLREANLLTWKTGGRKKGSGGRALANEYYFNLPSKPALSRQVAHPAVGGSCSLQGAGDASYSVQPLPTISNNQPNSQPSVTETEAASDDFKKQMISLSENWSATKALAQEKVEERREVRRGVIDEAMAAAGVSDVENKRIFSSTIIRRDSQQCLEVIFEFASQMRNQENLKLRNPAAELNKRLAALPTVR